MAGAPRSMYTHTTMTQEPIPPAPTPVEPSATSKAKETSEIVEEASNKTIDNLPDAKTDENKDLLEDNNVQSSVEPSSGIAAVNTDLSNNIPQVETAEEEWLSSTPSLVLDIPQTPLLDESMIPTDSPSTTIPLADTNISNEDETPPAAPSASILSKSEETASTSQPVNTNSVPPQLPTLQIAAPQPRAAGGLKPGSSVSSVQGSGRMRPATTSPGGPRGGWRSGNMTPDIPSTGRGPNNGPSQAQGSFSGASSPAPSSQMQQRNGSQSWNRAAPQAETTTAQMLLRKDNISRYSKVL